MSRFVREDIIELMEVFSQNCKRYEFIIDNYKFNLDDDFDKLPLKEATVFKFQGYDPYIYLESYGFSCRLYLSDVNNIIQQGMKGKIEGIFNRNRSVISYFRKIFFNFIAMGIIGFILGQLTLRFFSIGIVTTTITAILFIITYYFSMKKYTILYLKKSRNELNFWDKYSESAIVTFIVTVSAGIAVAIITKYM